MENYEAGVNYELCQTSSRKNPRTLMVSKTFKLSASLLIYSLSGELIIEQPMCRDNLFSLYHLVCKDKSGKILSDVSLTKFYIEVKDNVLIIGVYNGGPKIRLKINESLKNAVDAMSTFYANVDLTTMLSEYSPGIDPDSEDISFEHTRRY